tara:strand:+ start:181 stop:540 length:360 start_codon:yes stop_codon:yes gene_type:complete
MKKLTTLISFLMIVNMIFGQETQELNNTKVKYVYSKSTINSYNEICDLLKNDEESLSKALTQYKKLDNQGKVILSTIEYAPISKRISQCELNTNSTNEEKAYSINAKNKYVLVTELIEQ